MNGSKSKSLAAIAACAFATATATAQPLPSVQPLPRTQTPPGVLEGQSPPRTDASRQGRPLQPRSDPESGALVPLTMRNSAAMPVWVTLFRDGMLDRAGCLMPNAERSWRLPADADRTPWKVVAEISGKNDECAQPVACTTSIDRRPGMSALEMRAGQKDCAWTVPTVAPAPKPPVLKRSGTAVNATRGAMWVTVYRAIFGSRSTLAAACVQPGESRSYDEFWDVVGITYYVQAELMHGPNCQQPVDCATTTEYSGGSIRLVATSQGCWWEQVR